jgi:hypothetical protein
VSEDEHHPPSVAAIPPRQPAFTCHQLSSNVITELSQVITSTSQILRSISDAIIEKASRSLNSFYSKQLKFKVQNAKGKIAVKNSKFAANHGFSFAGIQL